MSNSGSKCFLYPEKDCPKDVAECRAIAIARLEGRSIEDLPCQAKVVEVKEEPVIIFDEGIHGITDRWERQAKMTFTKSRSELDGD